MARVLICLVLLCEALSANTLLHYEFHDASNPWEDKSSNGFHAQSSLDASLDQRGLYCPTNAPIELPPNREQLSTISIPSSFSIVTWVYALRSDNRPIFWRGYNDETLIEFVLKTGKKLEINVHTDGTDSNWDNNVSVLKSDGNDLSKNMWQLLAVTVTDTGSDLDIKLYSTHPTAFLTLTEVGLNYDEPSDRTDSLYQMSLCENGSGNNFRGYIYMFKILDAGVFTMSDYATTCNAEWCTACTGSYVCACDTGVGCDCPSDQYESGSDCLDCSAINDYCAGCFDSSDCAICSFAADNPADCTCGSSRVFDLASNACICEDGHYYINEVCKPCTDISDYCTACNADFICTSCTNSPTTVSDCSCDTDEYLRNGVCSPCTDILPDCATCTDDRRCLSCSNGRSAAYDCECAPNEFLSGSDCVDCSTISPYCNECNSSGDCIQCSNNPVTLATCACDTDQYNYLGECSSCTNISPHCLTCNDAGTCLSCSFSAVHTEDCSCGDDKYKDGSTCADCSQLNTYCVECTDAGVCTSCSNSAATVTDCGCADDEYNSSGTCISCSNISFYCTQCSDAGLCLSCFNGSTADDCACGASEYNHDGTCTNCSNIDSFCTECTDQGVCTSCSNTPTTVADCGCSANEFRDGSGNCLDCTTISLYCTACDGAGQCTSCTNGPATLATCSCGAGNYNFEGLCVSCTQISLLCTDCNDDGTCNTCTGMNTATDNCECDVNEYLDGAGDCVSCLTGVSNCIACNSSGDCIECDNGANTLTDCSCDSDEFMLNGYCTLMTQLNPFCDGVDVATGTCNSCSNSGVPSDNCNCSASQYLDSSGACSSCTDFGVNCSSCTEYGTCTSCLNNGAVSNNCDCLPNQYTSGPGVCVNCDASITYCNVCTDASTCTECSNYAITSASVSTCACPIDHYEQNGLCISCSEINTHCQQCSDDGTCTLCDNLTVATADCTCDANEVINSSGACEACSNLISYCVECISETVCTECSNGANEIDTCTCNGGPCECNITYGSLVNGNCVCPNHASISGSECVCDSGYFASCGDACTESTFACLACDFTCRECSGTSSFNCTACPNEQAPEETGECLPCPDNYYLSDRECIDCPELCLICSNNICAECVENAVFEGGQCICNDISVYSNGICDKQWYFITLKVSATNQLTLTFDEPLSERLTEDNLDVVLADSIEYSWNLETSTVNASVIELTLKDKVHQGELVQVTVSSPPVSKAGLPTIITRLNGTLYSWYPEQDPQVSKIAGQVTVYAQASAVGIIATSILINKPSLAWTLISTIQFLSLIPLAGVALPELAHEALLALSHYNIVPNLIEFIAPDTGEEPDSYAANYGYNSVYILINAGKMLTVLGVVGLVHFILLLLSITSGPTVSEFCQNGLRTFSLGIYLRLSLLAYLDIAAAALIQVTHVYFIQLSSSSTFAAMNVAACLLAIVRAKQTFACGYPVVMTVFVLKNQQSIMDDLNNRFHQKWGSWFYELRLVSRIGRLHYVGYLLRRLWFIGTLAIGNGTFEFLTNSLVAGAVFLYVVVVKPFNEGIVQLVNVATEGGTALVFALASYYNLQEASEAQEYIQFGISAAPIAIISVCLGGMAYQVSKALQAICERTRAFKEQQLTLP